MELEQERLINEILWWSRTENDDTRPNGDASGPWMPEIATVTSQVRRIWNSDDYDRLSRHMEVGAESFYRRLERRPSSQPADYAGSVQFTAVRPAACLRRVHGRTCGASCGSSQLHPGFLCRRCLLAQRGGPRGRFRGRGGLGGAYRAAGGLLRHRAGRKHGTLDSGHGHQASLDPANG